MTVVLISKRSVEMQLLVCWALVGVLAGVLVGAPTDEELPESAKLIVDETRPMNDSLLDSIVKEYSNSVKQTMDDEIGRLIGELEQQQRRARPDAANKKAAQPGRLNEEHLLRLRRANEQASAEIKTRIELAADTSGALPQWSPGQAAAGLMSVASSRLQAASSFTRDKMRSLASYAADRAPARLKRFFRWPSFTSFKAKFNKNYSVRQELYRQMVYLRNQVLVGVQWVRFLLRRDKYITGATEFSDWTEEEYLDTFSNEAEAEAAAGANESDGQLGQLSEQAKVKLLQLAQSGKNAFGQQVPNGPREPARRRRRKRQVADMDEDLEDEYDELNDTEDEGLDMELDDEDDEASDEPELSPEEQFRLLEEFSNADVDQMDIDLEDAADLADEALAVNSNFTPIDLRDTNCIIESENQHTCGNCYAHVIAAGATYYDCMANGGRTHVRFHSRFLSDCGRYLRLPGGQTARIKGCEGGLVSHTFQFAQRLGMQRFGQYQIGRIGYDWKNDTCVYPEPLDLDNTGWTLHPIEQYRRSRLVRLHLSEIDLHLRTIGPVFANIRYWANFKQYSDGIYDGFEDPAMGGIHSVLIVGRNIDSRGRLYYIIRNSHGTVWGEHGFFRIYETSLDYFSSSFAGLAPMELDN